MNCAHTTSMLDNLCLVAGRQGGTIHQFIDTGHYCYDAFRKSYEQFRSLHVEFNSKRAFDKLANQYHMKINWS